jgi:hypothetical protein
MSILHKSQQNSVSNLSVEETKLVKRIQDRMDRILDLTSHLKQINFPSAFQKAA